MSTKGTWKYYYFMNIELHLYDEVLFHTTEEDISMWAELSFKQKVLWEKEITSLYRMIRRFNGFHR